VNKSRTWNGYSIMNGKWKEVVRPATSEAHSDRSAHQIEDLLRELAKKIPQEEWDKLPDDLNANLDHYLYGTPKK
jgi:hypothetical protein